MIWLLAAAVAGALVYAFRNNIFGFFKKEAGAVVTKVENKFVPPVPPPVAPPKPTVVPPPKS